MIQALIRDFTYSSLRDSITSSVETHTVSSARNRIKIPVWNSVWSSVFNPVFNSVDELIKEIK